MSVEAVQARLIDEDPAVVATRFCGIEGAVVSGRTETLTLALVLRPLESVAVSTTSYEYVPTP